MNVFQEMSVMLRRLYSLQVSELAIKLAIDAGETIERPLQQQQIERAMQVIQAEYVFSTDWLFALWDKADAMDAEAEKLKSQADAESAPR